jgi:hypothetical protein
MQAPDTASEPFLLAYCERSGDAGLWAEPLNAVTNLAFIVFAWLALSLLRQVVTPSNDGVRTKKNVDIVILIFSMFAIGIGSGLWHTHATGWTVIADVIPIYIFINLYIFSLFCRQVRIRFWQVVIIWLIFQASSVLIEMYAPRDLLNGSIMYIPSYAMLFIGTVWLAAKHNPQWRAMAIVTAIFTLSITFRTIDLMVCDAFPLGTHFLWHLLNAWVLYRLVVIVMPKEISA